MKKDLLRVLAVVLAMTWGGTAFGQYSGPSNMRTISDGGAYAHAQGGYAKSHGHGHHGGGFVPADYFQGGCSPCGTDACYDVGGTFGGCGTGGGGGVFAEAELLLWRYTRADGIRIGTAADDSSKFRSNPAPRITAGFVGPGGLGIRSRYFTYDHYHTMPDMRDGSGIGVDTYTLDVEVFERFQLNPLWSAEISGGIRYNEFYEDINAVGAGEFRSHEFDGIGGVIGVDFTRQLTQGASLYSKARMALLVGDQERINSVQGVVVQHERFRDTTQGMLELGFGVQFERGGCGGPTFFARSGFEWQNWFNYSSAFGGDRFLGPDSTTWVGASDVGFYGLTFSVGVAR